MTKRGGVVGFVFFFFFLPFLQDILLACIKDNESVADRHVATVLIKTLLLKPKDSCFLTAQSSPGSVLVQSSARVVFPLLSSLHYSIKQ